MNKLYIPITAVDKVDLNKILVQLKKIGAERLYLAADRYSYNREERIKELEYTKHVADFFKAEGLDVGVWICSFGFGGPTAEKNREIANSYVRIQSISGKIGDDAICPMDESYTAMMADMVEDICRYGGVDMVMLDDEMCLNIRPGGLGCACDLHMAAFRKRLGEHIKREELAAKVFSGGPSKYRDAWIDTMGESMKNFCRKMREGADRVSKDIRLGFCSGYTSWDMEGADALELTEILAGESGKPFLRTTGANYWIHTNRIPRQTLQTIIETVRMQNAWTKGRGIDLFTEGDNYPRERFHTSAASAECYDIGCRLDGGMASYKYMFNYSCEADLDKYYIDAHMRNVPIYEKIEEHFDSKTAVGIRVYEEMRKFRNYDLPKTFTTEKDINTRTFFSKGQAILTSNAIPTVYEGRGICGIAFGENAKYIDNEAISSGLILDAKAAKILEERGIDVGLASIDGSYVAGKEYFGNKERYVDNELFDTGAVCKVTLKEGAKALSSFSEEGDKVAAYTYENADGQRFLVYCFVAEDMKDSSSLFWSYSRGKQINDTVEWLSGGKKLPVATSDNPHLYCIAKEGDGALAAGYLNCHLDAAYDVEIKLDREVASVEFIGCTGRLDNGNTVVIDRIDSYGFAGFVVK